jgi:hypothetical protein
MKLVLQKVSKVFQDKPLVFVVLLVKKLIIETEQFLFCL